MADRYFVQPGDFADQAELTGDEAHHLARVMRAGPGTEVILFDGSGWEYAAVVESATSKRVLLKVVGRSQPDRELTRPITLAVALPKGERQRWLVEKSVELGVARLVPLLTQRGVAQPVEQALRRLERAVIEASKQCGRNRLMEIAPPCRISELQAAAGDAKLLAHPEGALLSNYADQLGTAGDATVGCLLAVGPEGGFTEEEVATARAAGWQHVGLGPRILRVETAALALVAQVAMLQTR